MTPSTSAAAHTLLCATGPDDRARGLDVLRAHLEEWSTHDRRDLGAALIDELHQAPLTAVRSSAALALTHLARYGTWDDGWTESVLRWWTREDDLRSFDPQDGWIHAVVRGADLIGALALARQASAARLLGACTRRLIAPTEFVWLDGEDEHIAYAIVCALNSENADHADPTAGGIDPTQLAWLGPLVTYLHRSADEPSDPCRANTLHTLRCLTMLLDVDRPVAGATRTPAHSAHIRSTVLAVLTSASPYLWSLDSWQHLPRM
ncbi:hypothetical protein KEM60_02402 [Austwickia sp. TVS 96-490-7B]|uniref:DUF2785 domain-containing protein n=1 Tax=Austwickia sp. TVS 96-490-7B TaxID=2830843 RepID=UPI001C56A2A3|nr:DUF2785 domain-containing protein [Austwickia sp. TVS 96-490-7B]MBW3086191.1 hypothetical protein [Austwickia sp. TVS 96-490-7B]